MRCQISSQSQLLVKGFLLYVLLISFVEKQLNSEAKPSYSMKDKFKKNEWAFNVEHLQNTSSCAYVVEPIKEPFAEWQLKELYHIKCVNVGHRCSATNGQEHACMQTYKTIKVHKRAHGTMTIYTGCVCAYHHHHNTSSITEDNL